MLVTLSTTLKTLTRIGQATAGRLKKLGLTTVRDLLFYYPSRYEDYSAIVAIRDLTTETVCTVQGEIVSVSNKLTPHKRQKITEVFVFDGTGSLKAVWFNQPYLTTQMQEGESISLAGKVEYTGFGLEMRSPEWEKIPPFNPPIQKGGKWGDGIHTARIVPVYPLTAGVTNRQMRFLVSQAVGALGEVEEWMDENVKCQNSKVKTTTQNLRFIHLHEAIQNVHYPESNELLAKARFRLKFEELFFLQLRKAITRHEVKSAKAPALIFQEVLIKKFVQSLPFRLTDAQRKAAWQIIKDTGRAVPMNRLLQGDVGSGKTIVALIAMVNTALNGYQAVLMAPTEILAKQHYRNICAYLSGELEDIEVVLWTRSSQKLKSQNSNLKTTTKNLKFLELIVNGKVRLIIGTHALIEEDVQFKNLALAIVDEQHRFGVEQRKALREKASPLLRKEGLGEVKSPHFLSMTATPIPRSLSLTLYGDLDVSVLDELPKGRKKIITKTVSLDDRDKAYEFIAAQVKDGRQVFVICPLIDESDALGVKAVTSEYEKLDKEIFPHIPVGLLHGKLNDAEKDEVQERFVKGEYKILVATSVVEVGVDVPNASVMMIEGADRFGLAQLHQFRGRVGRMEHQSYCFLFTDSQSQTVYERLDFLTREHDGFKIAEYDLQLRGAGNMYGTEQHGMPEFKIASFQDYKLIELTQTLARDIIEKDPTLGSFSKMHARLEQEGGTVHLE